MCGALFHVTTIFTKEKGFPRLVSILVSIQFPDFNNFVYFNYNRTPGPGQGSDGMTPQVGGVMTPRVGGTPGLTPGRTPLRDKLNINTEEQLADPAYAKHMVK